MKMQVRIALLCTIAALAVSWVVMRLHNDGLEDQLHTLRATSAPAANAEEVKP